jgi:photosystem II stability/assembly factor-like uncharacterized protein
MKHCGALVAGLLFICAPITRAADIVWTNLAGGNWSASTNWSPNQIPSSADHAVITNAGTYTVIVDAAVTVDAITVGGASGRQTLSNFVATLTLNGNGVGGTNATFALSGNGVLAGNGDLTVAGRFDWTGGVMQGNGRTIIAPGAVLDISGSGYNKQLYRALDLRGNGTFSGGGWLYGGFGVPFNIFPGSTFDLQGDQQMPYGGGGNFAQLNVAGTLRKSSGTSLATVGFTLNNAGLVQAQSGTFNFAAGGWSSGQFDAANNTIVNFGGGTHTVTNGVSFTATGSGFHRVDNGTLDIATALTMNQLFELTANGTVAGNSNLTFTSTLRWTGGVMQGNGRTIIAPGAVLDISGSGYNKQLYRALDLRGNGTFSGGGWLYGGFGVPFNIFPGSTFDLQGDQQMPYGGGGNFAQLNVAGTLRKSSGTSLATVGFTLNNAGLVQAQSGTFNFAAGGWSSGQFDAANNTIVNFGGGTHTVTNGVSFTATGSGFHRVDNGTLDIATALTMNQLFELTANGTVAGNSNLTFTSTLRWTGGVMQGNGRTIIAPGAVLDISGSGYNKQLYRALDLRGNGTFSGGGWLYGGFGVPFNIFPGSTFDLQGDQQMPYGGGGNFAQLNVAGTLRKSAGNGLASIGFATTNIALVESRSGTLSFAATYVQNAGTTLLNGGGFGGNAILDIRGGELRGAGNISGDVRNWADVHPGGPFGFLSISNSVTQIYSNTANGRLNLQLGGLLPGTNHDQVRINGQANLSGTINVDFVNGFVPAIGNSFTVMTYTARSGQFAGITAPPGVTLQPAYFPTHLVLNAVAVTQVPPFIITHPTNVVLKEGLTATFRVVASGTPQLNYQWQRNAIDIPGARSDTLVVPGVTVTNAGAYRVLVSNLAGITNSLSATLIVEPGFQTVEIDTGITNVLTGASFINGLNGAIVGRDGSMRITRDGGATWNVVNTGMTEITDVQFVGGAIFIAGGGAHTICVSYDGGLTWEPAYSGTQRIFRMRFLSPGYGYAVGDGVILRWDGTAWTPDLELDVRLLSIDYCGGFPVAVGEGGRIYQFTGTNWVLRHTEVNLATFNDVKFCGSGGTGIAVGTGGVIYRTTNCGLDWEPFTNPTFSGALRSITFGDCGTWWVSGDDGVILQSEDGGQTWGTIYSGTTRHIREIVFIDGYGYYIDDGGHIHRFVYLPIPQNLPPVITLVQPAGAVTNWACTRLPLRALASDPNGFIAKVEFFAQSTSIEVDTTYPTWTGAWTNCDIGTFTVTAVATDNRGATAVSNPIKVTTIHPPLHTLIPAGFMDRAPDAGFKLCMTGETGRQYEVYAHTNVVAPFATWEYLGLMSEFDRLFSYLDRGATNLPYRFYRAKQVP